MAKKKKKQRDTGANLPLIMDYGIGSISIYDPVAMMPYRESLPVEQTCFKKLGKELKVEFKWMAASLIMEHWEEKQQIPFESVREKMREFTHNFMKYYGT